MGSHVFKWPYPAKDVHVTGTFDDWAKSVQMEQVGDEWVKEVELPSADEKVLYKYVVDGEWKVDANLPIEGDGHYNTNNVLHPEQITRKTASADVPGAFPGTPSVEDPTFSVQPIPGTAGSQNPITVAPGAPLPPQKDITSNTVESGVTTSKEDFDNAGSSSAGLDFKKDEPTFSVNPLPSTTGAGVTTSQEDFENAGSSPAGLDFQKDEPTFSVNPIPSTTGAGITTSKEDFENAGDSAKGMDFKKDEPTFSVDPLPSTTGAGITTSKEDFDNAGSSAAAAGLGSDQTFSVNPIPATGGIGNPVSVPAGSPLPDQKDITSNTVNSTVTTSKEDYEKAGSGITASAVAVGGAALGGAALLGAHSSSNKKNIIPESSLPMGPEATSTLQTTPFISSSAGAGTTTGELASRVPFEKDTATAKLAEELEIPLKQSPFISSSGPGTTTSDLAAKVPLESDPTIRSSGPGTTTAALAANVPVEKPSLKTEPLAPGVPEVVGESISSAHQAPEAAASPEAVKDKADLEKELLSKTQTSEATGKSASAAAEQTSYYGLATSVPTTVEKSMQKAHAAPEAAVETSAVAEKSAVERELLSKVPSTEEAGEPAPTIAAATSETAPASTAAAAAATSITDGKTANEAVPDTDTSSAARGLSAGELAGGAVVGGAAAAGAATLAAKHEDADVEPPRVADSAKPDITTEASPATATTDRVPGQLAFAAAAVLDGASATPITEVPKTLTSTESTEAATTEYAPVRTSALAPGVSSAAAAALSDGTEDPTLDEDAPALADEPAVKLMNQNEPVMPVQETAPASIAAAAAVVGGGAANTATTSAPSTLTTAVDPTARSAEYSASAQEKGLGATGESSALKTKDISDIGNREPSALLATAPVPTLTSAGTGTANVAEQKGVGSSEAKSPSAPTTPAKQRPQSMAVSSPATSAADSSATDKKKKKRHRLSAFIHKIFD